VITQQPDRYLSAAANQSTAERETPARWYADAFRADRRADRRPAGRAEAHIDFLGLFLHRALAGARRLDSRA
jgi:hypothetical protein